MGSGRDEFEVLFTTEFDVCVAVAARITGQQAVAEELAAEAFVRAWTRWPWLRRQPSPGGWLMRVTTNLALDHWRRGPAPSPGVIEVGLLEDAAVTHLALMSAINQLSTRQRTAVSLRYLADLSVDAVAEAMHVSPGSVKSHLHRGLAHLQQLLLIDVAELEAGLAR